MSLTVKYYKGIDLVGEEIIVGVPFYLDSYTGMTLSNKTLDELIIEANDYINKNLTLITSDEITYTILSNYGFKCIQAYFYSSNDPYTITFDAQHSISLYSTSDQYGNITFTKNGINVSSGPVYPSGRGVALTMIGATDISDDIRAYRLLFTSRSGIDQGATWNVETRRDTTSIIKEFWDDIEEYIPPEPGGEDPYEQGGTTGDDETEPTGGDGDYDGDSDDIAIPLPPTNSAVDSGFITLYNPTMAEIQALGAFMWSDLFDLDTFKKLFGDPMGAILGLSLVPVQPPQGSTVEVKIGNVLSGVRMKTISNQFIQKDFGTITLNEYWGGYLDYSPYTQVEVYLPFIGVKPLSVDDVMGKSIHLVYNIDLLSGACMAFIAVNEDVLYQFIGQCSCSVPITGSDWTNVINGVLGIAGAIGTTVATGGLSAPQAIGAVTALASSVASSKPRVEKSGSLSGMGGMLGVFSPYLIITRPRQALPASQNAFEGYPAFITRTLGTVSGFTRVREVHLDGMTCTDQEKDEIKRLLDEGVIF